MSGILSCSSSFWYAGIPAFRALARSSIRDFQAVPHLLVAALFFVTFASVSADESMQEVTVEGAGQNQRTALEDAFRQAIEDTIGLYVNSETRVKNNQIIHDEILTFSKGYIDHYLILLVATDPNVTKVKIKAAVRIQAVERKLSNLKLATIDAGDSANAFARLATKAARRDKAEAILRQEFASIFTHKEILKLLQVQIQDYRIFENKLAKDNTVPFELSYTISIDEENYQLRAEELARVFQNLGGNVDSIVSLHDGNALDAYTAKLSPFRSNSGDKVNACFGVVLIKENRKLLNDFCFPYEWNTIFPWSVTTAEDRKYLQDLDYRAAPNMALALVFRGDNKIVAENMLERGIPSDLSFLLFSWNRRSAWGSWAPKLRGGFIGPFVSSGPGARAELSFTYKGKIDSDLLLDIRSVDLEIREH